MNALQALRQERQQYLKLIGALDTAIAALESVNGDAQEETISLAPTAKRSRKQTKVVKAKAPKPTSAKQARRPRITSDHAAQIIRDFLAAGPSTIREIEAGLAVTETPMAYPAINRAVKLLVDDGSITPVGDNRRNTEYALNGSSLAAPEDEVVDESLLSEPDEGDEEDDLVLASAEEEEEEEEEQETTSETYSF